MPNEFTIKIAGEAGQGMQTIGAALSRLYKKAGFHIFANQDYMSRVRGGNNFFQLRVSEKPVFTLHQKADIVVALDKKSVALHKAGLSDKGVMVLDRKQSGISETEDSFFDVALHELAASIGGSDIFINTAACGVIAGMTAMTFGLLEEVIREAFSDKGSEIIEKNIKVAKAGYEFAQGNFKKKAFSLNAGPLKDTLFLNGNEAIALAAIKAGCKFYTAYPMTPSTSIMNTLAHYAAQYNIVVEQAEDEIAAINMALGASFAGVRAMTATSGGGFALMVEGLSLAGMTETPVVIAEVQRPAPATGFPTRTEQADLDFLLHAGHGEFARAIYAPGTIEEAFYLTLKAFNIAEKYQIPVLIMSDQHLADSYRDIEPFDLRRIKVERSIISKEESKEVSGYTRYKLTESGISPRAIPSWIEGVIYADSDEHTEEGHITEDAATRIQMVEKRLYKKMAGLCGEIEKPTEYNITGASCVLLGFGSTYGVLKELCEKSGNTLGFMHFSQVWPFPAKETDRILKDAKKIITVENNALGQLARLLKRECAIKIDGSILRFDGRPFDLEYVDARLKKYL
ncbi:MAG: 2-oxoacid:acceptor oxidoreductase subunit alpha [Candidatus Omnitrophota bacterium]